MSTTFYKSIIEDEIKAFNIKEESLKAAAKSVSEAYSRKSLTRGQTFLDYNIPSNRCAYIYKYASIHTGLVFKYFAELLCEKEVKSSLQKKETLKICCLGGGPGTDIIGLFKVLASCSNYYKKVVEVTVLDICGGWRNSFKRIMTHLISGKVKDVPETFINVSDFKFKLIEIDLLQNLPVNVATILSEADIVCMVKFVSAILASSTSIAALQVIGSKLKVEAVVLFIDNFNGNVFKPVFDVSQQIGLQLILGPIHKTFRNKNKFHKGRITSKEKNMFGCLPLTGTSVTVLGFMKSDTMSKCTLSNSINTSAYLLLDDDDNGWDTDNSDSDTLVKKTLKNPKTCYHNFAETNKKYLGVSNCDNTCVETSTANVLYSLVDRLSDLFSVLSQLKQQITTRNQLRHCHHCH